MSNENASGSRHNALKHGITSATLLLRDDEKIAYELHLEAILKQYVPASDAESALVQRIADHQWQIHRACVSQINVTACTGAIAANSDELDPRQHLDTLARVARTLNNYVLYETRLRKRIAKEEAELEALRATRKALEREQNLQQPANPNSRPGPVAVPTPAKREESLVFSAALETPTTAAPPQQHAGA